jgi:hypothetical protein
MRALMPMSQNHFRIKECLTSQEEQRNHDNMSKLMEISWKQNVLLSLEKSLKFVINVSKTYIDLKNEISILQNFYEAI